MNNQELCFNIWKNNDALMIGLMKICFLIVLQVLWSLSYKEQAEDVCVILVYVSAFILEIVRSCLFGETGIAKTKKGNKMQFREKLDFEDVLQGEAIYQWLELSREKTKLLF